MLEQILVLGPLVAAALAGFFQKQLRDEGAMAVTIGTVCASAAISIYLFFTKTLAGADPYVIEIARWISVGEFDTRWAVRVDALSVTMMCVVTIVSALVHIYSVGYMSHDPHRARFFSYLSLFTFAMLALVSADDFLQVFFGWEGVGLASYLLIGFWYDKSSANDAAIKAFIVNRVGDVGFALGIIAIFLTFGTLQFDAVFAEVERAASENFSFLWGEWPVLEVIGVLLFIGAMGKSAQFFLHVWLPDAMEGPTPVSALIHAATMVTAGVFLVCRASPIYAETVTASMIITLVGATTALYAATVGLAQNDIKRVIAYSTCSQLGYMFFAAGVGAYSGAMFHLVTHAFFKALLFLGAGSVIHGVHDEQDMRKMGGLWGRMPWTWAAMLIGTLALTGVGIPFTTIGFAGFFSKDWVIEMAYGAGDATGAIWAYFAFWVGVFVAGLTAFYSWRLVFMTFHGPYRGEHKPHESNWIMLGPLVPLVAGAIFSGYLLYKPMVKDGAPAFWNGALVLADAGYGDAHGEGHAPTDEAAPAAAAAADIAPDKAKAKEGGYHFPDWVIMSPFIAMLSGLSLAILLYLLFPGIPRAIGRSGGPLHAFLSNRWYFDHLYHWLFVRGAERLGDLLWKGGDQRIIDGLGPDGVAAASARGARRLMGLQTGYLYHYAFVMLVAVAALLGLGLYLGGRS